MNSCFIPSHLFICFTEEREHRLGRKSYIFGQHWAQREVIYQFVPTQHCVFTHPADATHNIIPAQINQVFTNLIQTYVLWIWREAEKTSVLHLAKRAFVPKEPWGTAKEGYLRKEPRWVVGTGIQHRELVGKRCRGENPVIFRDVRLTTAKAATNARTSKNERSAMSLCPRTQWLTLAPFWLSLPQTQGHTVHHLCAKVFSSAVDLRWWM